MSDSDDAKLLSRCALGLFLLGPVGFFPMAAWSRFELALGFLIVCEVLALALAWLSRYERISRIVVGGVVIALVLSAAFVSIKFH